MFYKRQTNAAANLYIINGVSGRILLNTYVSDVDFNYPINLLFSENTVYVSYFNLNQMKYEIWVLESFENLIENSFIGKFILLDMLKKYYY